MATLKAGTTVGGLSLLTSLKPSNLTEGQGEINQFLGVDYDNSVKFIASFQGAVMGTTKGFVAGGQNTAAPAPTTFSAVESYPLAVAPLSSTSVGNLTNTRNYVSGHSSSTISFNVGGSPFSNRIDYFPFVAAAPFASTTTGNLSQGRQGIATTQTKTTGYSSTGEYTNDPLGPVASTVIDSYPFSSPFVTATNVGSIGGGMFRAAGTSSATTSFVTGGNSFVPGGSIYSFPFSAPFTSATSVGTTTPVGGINMTGHSSVTTSYVQMNYGSIETFPFAATSPFSSVSAGSLSQARTLDAAIASTTHGYHSGGYTSGLAASAVVDRFPFSAAFATATSVGSLTAVKFSTSGTQY